MIRSSRHTLYIKGFSSNLTIDDILDYFKNEEGLDCSVDFARKTHNGGHMSLAVRFKSSVTARDVMCKFNQKPILGCIVTMSWYRDYRTARELEHKRKVTLVHNKKIVANRLRAKVNPWKGHSAPIMNKQNCSRSGSRVRSLSPREPRGRKHKNGQMSLKHDYRTYAKRPITSFLARSFSPTRGKRSMNRSSDRSPRSSPPRRVPSPPRRVLSPPKRASDDIKHSTTNKTRKSHSPKSRGSHGSIGSHSRSKSPDRVVVRRPSQTPPGGSWIRTSSLSSPLIHSTPNSLFQEATALRKESNLSLKLPSALHLTSKAIDPNVIKSQSGDGKEDSDDGNLGNLRHFSVDISKAVHAIRMETESDLRGTASNVSTSSGYSTSNVNDMLKYSTNLYNSKTDVNHNKGDVDHVSGTSLNTSDEIDTIEMRATSDVDEKDSLEFEKRKGPQTPPTPTQDENNRFDTPKSYTDNQWSTMVAPSVPPQPPVTMTQPNGKMYENAVPDYTSMTQDNHGDVDYRMGREVPTMSLQDENIQQHSACTSHGDMDSATVARQGSGSAPNSQVPVRSVGVAQNSQGLSPINVEKVHVKKLELEQLYRQDCDTFATVVKMLISKEPCLESLVHHSLKENLRDMGQNCLDELKQYVTQLKEEERSNKVML